MVSLRNYAFGWGKKAAWWLLNAMRLQLFLTLVAWPILLCWGLPVSFLSPLGNLIFAPFLFCFLILASLIFFTELVGIAPSLLYTVLETLTAAWLACCHWGSQQALLALPRCTWWCALFALVAASFIMYHPRWRQPAVSTLLLFVLVFAVMQYGMWSRSWSALSAAVLYGKTSLTIIYEHEKLIITDPGLSRCRKNCNNWISYTLMPFLSTTYGALSIDEYRVTKLTPFTCTLLESLCQKKIVKRITIVQDSPKNLVKQLQEIAAKYDVNFCVQKE